MDNRRKDEGTFFKKLGTSFKHGVDGIVYAVENELNALIMMILTILTFVLGFLLRISFVELAIIVVCIGVTFALEMVNSAIEALGDAVTLEENKLIKIAKDCGTAGILVMSFISILVGGVIFIPKIIALF